MLLWKRVYICSWTCNPHAFTELRGGGVCTLSSPVTGGIDIAPSPSQNYLTCLPSPLMSDGLVLLSIIYIG